MYLSMEKYWPPPQRIAIETWKESLRVTLDNCCQLYLLISFTQFKYINSYDYMYMCVCISIMYFKYINNIYIYIYMCVCVCVSFTQFKRIRSFEYTCMYIINEVWA